MASNPLDSFKILGCFKRRFKSGNLAPPEDVVRVFNDYAENSILTPEKFLAFLKNVQGEKDMTLESAKKLFDQEVHKDKLILTKARGMTLETFFHFLFDPLTNSALNNQIHQDMTRPASHYFVYTGHNSYLTGNQLNSDCSEVPIISALKRGVRVIELDLWPNKKQDNINVLHGGTMTSPVKFDVCMAAIRDHAFDASDYPVVITFEDHLTPQLQAKAAEITNRILGKILKIPDENESFTEFPSPEVNKKRILISTKPPKEYLEGKPQKEAAEKAKVEKASPNGKGKGPSKAAKEDKFDWGDEVPNFGESGRRAEVDPSKVPRGGDGDVLGDEEEEEDDEKAENEAIDHVVHPDYKRMISIRAEKPKGKSIVDCLAVDKNVRRVSLSEPQLQKTAKNHPDAVIKFTERNLLRIYPYGLRFNSSNYNPLNAWSHGAQMVAFNMQGYGRPLWLVHGFFRANGGCGYVLKPDFLFPSTCNSVFNPREVRPPKTTLRIKVIMGMGWLERFGKHYFDTFSPPDFYARVGIAGVPADTIMKKTEPIEDEWLPQWEVQFDFPLSVPELALLRVEVHEYDMTDKDDFGGQMCIPVLELKSGYRSIPLLDKKGDTLTGVRLLALIEFIPEGRAS